MPIWTNNKLDIYGSDIGDGDTIKKFIRFNNNNNNTNNNNNNNEDIFSFNNTVPLPNNESISTSIETEDEKIDRQMKERQLKIAKWGTKWDACEVSINKISDLCVKINFMTAWCYPDKWLETVVAKFTNLQFRLSWLNEEMMCGYLISYKGKLFSRNFYEDTEEYYNFIEREFPEDYENIKEYRVEHSNINNTESTSSSMGTITSSSIGATKKKPRRKKPKK